MSIDELDVHPLKLMEMIVQFMALLPSTLREGVDHCHTWVSLSICEKYVACAYIRPL